MQEYAKHFYLGVQWKKCRAAFMQSKGYVCEMCGAPAEIAHHIEHISPANIHDVNITLSWDNLMCVCRDCHGLLHSDMKLSFDEAGQIVKAKPDVYQTELDKLLANLDKVPARGAN